MVTQGPTKCNALKPLINSNKTLTLNLNSFQRLCGPSKNLISDFVMESIFSFPIYFKMQLVFTISLIITTYLADGKIDFESIKDAFIFAVLYYF